MKPRLQPSRIEGVYHQGNAPVLEDYFEYSADRGVFVLSDGFGGSIGKRAAHLATQSIKSFLERESGDLDATLPFELRPYFSLSGNILFNAIGFANQSILKMNEKKTPMYCGGASVLAATLEGRLFSLASVGACRAYLKRKGFTKKMIQPKTLGHQKDFFSEEGELAQVPLMSLGTSQSLEPEMIEIELQKDDEILWLSSGAPMQWLDQWKTLQKEDVPLWLEQISALKTSKIQHNATLVWITF